MEDKELMEFLLKRGMKEREIDLMVADKIDREVMKLADDETLARFIPKQGDRIAVKQFCLTKDTHTSTAKEKKRSLLNTLRDKLNTTSGNRETSMPKKKNYLRGNANAAKATRKIELGWLHFDQSHQLFKQVKKANGGGTRKIDISKSAKKGDILDEAKHRFFAGGKSKIGSLHDFEVTLRDFSEQLLTGDETIGDMYEKTGMNILRFYLTTKPTSPPAEPTSKKQRESRFPDMTLLEDPVMCSQPTATSTCISDSQDDDSMPSSPLPNLGEFFQSPLQWKGAFENVTVGAEMSVETTPLEEHYRDEDVSFTLPFQPDHETVINMINPGPSHEQQTEIHIEENEEETPIHHIQARSPVIVPQSPTDDEIAAPTIEKTNSVVLTVHRGSNAFFELIAHFKDPDIMSKHITVNRVLPNGEKEMAEDTGGVFRDTLSEFWSTFYEMCTIGREAKVPALRHDLGHTEWQAIGRILLYGYRRTRYWPVKLAKSFILSIICEEEVEGTVVLQDFWSYVASSDKEVLQEAYNNYSLVDQDDLLESLDSYQCRTSPNADNIRAILHEIAHTLLIQKPTFVRNCMREELRKAKLGKMEIEQIYGSIKPTAKKVIGLLQFPQAMNGMESEVAKHLKRYVKDSDSNKLGLFMRFCTGSDLLTVEKINVEFTSLVGLERRPTAHTCVCVLHLPRMYDSFMDFRYEFDNILSHNIWIMDIV